MQKVTGSTLGYFKHDAVEERAVVITFAHQAEEVVAVLRRFVVEAKGDVAQVGLESASKGGVGK